MSNKGKKHSKKRNPRQRLWRSFEKAREWARALNTNSAKWKDVKLPFDIPRSPHRVYKDVWINWQDWLGTERGLWEFKEAREWARTSTASSKTQWSNLDLPIYIPRCPECKYPNEWKGWGDWLGTENKPFSLGEWLSFEECKAWATLSNANTKEEWFKISLPSNIPKDPSVTFRTQWQGWGDWLGTGNTASFQRVYRSFFEAREWARQCGAKTHAEWSKIPLPPDIPRSPWQTYKKEWTGICDWLGTGKNFLPFEEARKWARSLKLKNQKQWRLYSDRPDNIPYSPDSVYKKDWVCWGDWTGNGVKFSPKNTGGMSKTRRAKSRPPWVKSAALNAFYDHAKLQTKATGIKHEVDHIDPLTHPLVCGLHVPANLRVITRAENGSKNNGFKPYRFNGSYYEFLD